MRPEPFLCALLRHEPCAWDAAGEPEAISRFLRAVRFHGVAPLLDAEFRHRGDLAGWPKDIQVECLKSALGNAARESTLRDEASRVIEALVADGVRPLVLKGGALAYSHYADPSLRPRNDTDLLIPLGARAQADATLGRLGYARAEAVAGEFISYESLWCRTDASGTVHRIDVHWRVNNAQALAKAFDYEDLASRALPLPALGPSARALDPVDALLLACVHRAGHATEDFRDGDLVRRGSERLIWLYDIHLLAGRLSEGQCDAFGELASARRLRAICHDALQRSRECFGTAIPPRLLESLGRPGEAEPSAAMLSAGEGRRMVADFVALENWRDRARWLRELAFPAAEYMRWKYPDAGAAWLPMLYLRRGLSGIARLATARHPESGP